MKKITWITADWFIECDFNPNVLKDLLKDFKITWIIVLPIVGARFKETDFEQLKQLSGLKIQYLYCPYRQRDPRRLLFYWRLYKSIKRTKPDIIYLNYVPDLFFVPFMWFIKKEKTIFCAHDGDVKDDVENKFILQFCFDVTYPFVRFVNMFSTSQAAVFQKNYPKAHIFMIPLGLKDFGKTNLLKREDAIVFFLFGTIHEGKNLSLLINAACNIYEKGYRGFKISINGNCKNWNFYKDKIKYPEIFECTIRIIANSEIPRLYEQSHYQILPYKNISQSGALKVAFNYNVPVIVSDLKGFTDEVKEGINGYIFQSNNVADLERVMIETLNNHTKEYSNLLARMQEYTNEHYSSRKMSKLYIDMFKRIVTGIHY